MFDWITKAAGNATKTPNLMNEALFGYMGANLVTWMDNNPQTFIDKGYRGNAAIFSIVRKIGDKKKQAGAPQVFVEKGSKESTVKYKSFKYSGDNEKHAISNLMRTKALDYHDDNRLARLLKNPNGYQTASQFFDAAAGFFDVCGECFIYGMRVGSGKEADLITEMHVMPSHLVDIIHGSALEPVKAYKFKIGNQSITIPATDVLHLKEWNPNFDLNGSQLRGQSRLLAGLKYLAKNDSGLIAATKSLQNEGAKGVLSPNHPDPKLWLTPTQVDTTEKAVIKKIDGQDNLNKVVISGMPLQYTQIGLSPVAQAIYEGLNHDFEALCGLWGISPLLFQPNATFANLLDAKKSLVTDICIPWHSMVEEGLMDWLVPAYNKADNTVYVLDFDTSIYTELRVDNEQVMKMVEQGLITHNEGRELLAFERYDDEAADRLYIAMGKIPIEDAAMGSFDPVEPIKELDYKDYLVIEEKVKDDLKGCLMFYPNTSQYEWERALKLLIPAEIVQEYEFEPHCTILYGLLDDQIDKSELVKFVIDFMKDKKISLSGDKLGVFSNELYDVVKIDILDDGAFTELNAALRTNFPYKNDYPLYRPHFTLAYVNKGEGSQFDGRSIDLKDFGFYYQDAINEGKIIYSDSNKVHTRIL